MCQPPFELQLNVAMQVSSQCVSTVTMAGIIGQLTANARARSSRKVRSDKCTYNIPEFDRGGFVPILHNSYVRNRTRMEARKEVKVLKVQESMETKPKSLTSRDIIWDILIICGIIFILPLGFIIYFVMNNFAVIKLLIS